MTNREEDRCFQRWQSHSDPAALARAFDLTAPKLLLVALHVSPHAAQAEDLLQTTFLQAMQGASQWDSAKPLFRWLAGILAHRAIDEQRRAGMRMAGALTPEQPSASVKDPLQASLDLELVRSVAAEIEALEGPYREVLILKLVHGLKPIEIAHTLERTPGTVRMQLKRGLERLRQELPKGLAVPGLLAIESARGLDSVKQAVMSRAATLALASAGSPLTWLLGGKAMWLGATALLLSLLAYWVTNEPIDSAPTPQTATSAKRAAQPTETLRAQEASPSARRSALAKTASASPAALSQEFVVRVCIETESKPASGVGVHLKRIGASGAGQTRKTGTQGTARFGTLPAGRYRVTPDRGRAQTLELQPTGKQELLIRLAVGFQVHGIVLDLNKQPVAGARVLRFNEDHPDGTLELTVSDVEGRFVLNNIPKGSRLMARADGFQPSRLGRTERASTARDPARLVLGARGHPLEGLATGPDGRPIPWAGILIAVDEDARKSLQGPGVAQVRAHQAMGQKFMDRECIFVRADAEGRFSTDEVPRGPATVLAHGQRQQDFFYGLGAWIIKANAVNRVQIKLELGSELSGRVSDTHGNPLPGLAVQAEWRGDPIFGQLEYELGKHVANPGAQTDVNGNYRLRGLLPGDYSLRLRSEDKTLKRHRIKVGKHETLSWDVVLESRSDLRIQLLDPAGLALKDWGIQVTTGHGHSPPRNFEATDEQGRATLTGLVNVPHTLWVHTRGSRADHFFELPVIKREDVRPSAQEWVLQLGLHEMPNAHLSWQVVDARDRPVQGSSAMLLQDGREDGARIHDSRAAQSPGLVAGNYRIRISQRQLGSQTFGPWSLATGESLDVGKLVLPDPNLLEISLLMEDGSSPARPEVYLAPESSTRPQNWPMRRSKDAPRDQWRSSPMPDGKLVLLAWAAGAAPLRAIIRVAGGSETKHSFRLPRGYRRELVIRYPAYVEGASQRQSKAEARLDIRVQDIKGNLLLNDRWGHDYDDLAGRVGRFWVQLEAGIYNLRLDDTHNPHSVRQLELTFGPQQEDLPAYVDFR